MKLHFHPSMGRLNGLSLRTASSSRSLHLKDTISLPVEHTNAEYCEHRLRRRHPGLYGNPTGSHFVTVFSRLKVSQN